MTRHRDTRSDRHVTNQQDGAVMGERAGYLSIGERLWELERRLGRVEARLGLAEAPPEEALCLDDNPAISANVPAPVAPPPMPPPLPASASPAWQGPAPLIPEYAPPRPTPPVPQTQLEQTIGLKWAGWIGAVVVVIGAGLGIKFAYEQGWFEILPPAARLALMSLGGFALIGA